MHPYLIVFFEFFGLILTLFSYGIMADCYMIPSLTSISTHYSLSQQFTGFLLAIGSSTPEFTTNLISTLQGKSDEAALGVGAITGSGSFDFTICFSIASLFTIDRGLQFNKHFYYRDSLVYVITVFLLMIFLRDNKIYLYEAIILVCLWPVYLLINCCFFRGKNEELAGSQSKNTNEINVEHKEHDDNKNNQIEIDKNDSNKNTDYIQNNTNNKIHIDQLDQQTENIDNDQPEKEKLLIHNDEETHMIIKDKNQDIPKKENYEHISLNSEDESNILIRTFEIITGFIRLIYITILPSVEKFPFIAFLFSLLIAFYHSKFIVYLVEDISNKTNIATSFFGITLISWAGNVGDSINASIATKAKKVDLLTTGILASQIMNLQICLGVPWTISMLKNSYQNKGEYVLDFGKENVNKLFIPLLFVVFLAIFIMFCFSRVLNKCSGFILMIVYLMYFVYELINSKKSE